jgi:protease I
VPNANGTDLNRTGANIYITAGFKQVEMTEPRKALGQAGAQTRIVSLT